MAMYKSHIHGFRAATYLTLSLTFNLSRVFATKGYTHTNLALQKSSAFILQTPSFSSLLHEQQPSPQTSPNQYYPLQRTSCRFVSAMKGPSQSPSTTTLRRSSRIRQQSKTISSSTSLLETLDTPHDKPVTPIVKRTRRTSSTTNSVDKTVDTRQISKRTKTTKTPPTKKKQKQKQKGKDTTSLPRTRELQLLQKHSTNDLQQKSTQLLVMGIDEAGRGPLAGPVVAAAVIIQEDIAGITDSKKITKETDREALFEILVKSKDIQWAVAIIDAPRIDEINILQATMEGMSQAAKGLVGLYGANDDEKEEVLPSTPYSKMDGSMIKDGSYLITSGKTKNKHPIEKIEFHALIDGNRAPKNMPCPSEPIVKGDSKEYSIGAASIFAKVIRDRIMHEYHDEFPHYNLKQHKGYPTAAHMQAVKEYGASPIHRRTFAPLKHMDLDENGKIIE